jgi:hypothetical protein
MSRELDLLRGRQLENLLELAADRQENLLTLLTTTALATSNIAFTSAGDALSDGTGPDTNSEEGLSDVDNYTHDLAIVLVLESLTNGGHHDLEPKAVDINVSLILVLVRPLAAVLVLGVLPLGADAGLEEVVVGFEGKLGNGCDIILKN